MLMVLALALAPLILPATHGPGGVLVAAEATAETAVHGHSRVDDAPRPGHDKTDHQHSAIPPPGRATQETLDREGPWRSTVATESATFSGPLPPQRASVPASPFLR